MHIVKKLSTKGETENPCLAETPALIPSFRCLCISIFYAYPNTYVEPNQVAAFKSRNKAVLFGSMSCICLFFFKNMGKSILYTLLYILLLIFKSWSCCISVYIDIYPNSYSWLHSLLLSGLVCIGR